MPSYGLTLRRTVAALFASLALLCAQLTALPDRPASTTGPVAVSAVGQAVVARLTTGLTLVKAERAGGAAKSAPTLDLILPTTWHVSRPIAVFRHTSVETEPHRLAGIASPYQARAPPVAVPPTFSIQFN